MAKLVTYIFIVGSLILWYFLLFGGGIGDGGGGGGGGNSEKIESNTGQRRSGGGSAFVGATNGGGSILDGRDILGSERGGRHIKRDINHCWRRYDGYNMQSTMVNRKEQQKKAFGILCNFKCTWLLTTSFPTCEFIYDYKLSCYLFTSLPDCTTVKCTIYDYFS